MTDDVVQIRQLMDELQPPESGKQSIVVLSRYSIWQYFRMPSPKKDRSCRNEKGPRHKV